MGREVVAWGGEGTREEEKERAVEQVFEGGVGGMGLACNSWLAGREGSRLGMARV